MVNKLTHEEKIALLKKFFVEDIYIKAMLETFNEQELDKIIDMNLNTLLAKQI